jgi:hypothetical protein
VLRGYSGFLLLAFTQSLFTAARLSACLVRCSRSVALFRRSNSTLPDSLVLILSPLRPIVVTAAFPQQMVEHALQALFSLQSFIADA